MLAVCVPSLVSASLKDEAHKGKGRRIAVLPAISTRVSTGMSCRYFKAGNFFQAFLPSKKNPKNKNIFKDVFFNNRKPEGANINCSMC